MKDPIPFERTFSPFMIFSRTPNEFQIKYGTTIVLTLDFNLVIIFSGLNLRKNKYPEMKKNQLIAGIASFENNVITKIEIGVAFSG